MIHISTFSGIGGFELASEWMGWKNYASCEINPFGQKVLKYYWPEAYHHGDIKTLTYELLNKELIQRFGTNWRCEPVILTGGFPCQPFSLAGKRKGTEDDRHLWPEMLRLIRELNPKYVVGENVGGIINWDRGLVFEQVQADLEAEGYEVQPFVLPACAVNAPHRRDRVWFIANNNKLGSQCGTSNCDIKKERKTIGSGIQLEADRSCSKQPKKDCNRDPSQPGSWRGGFERLCSDVHAPNCTDPRIKGLQSWENGVYGFDDASYTGDKGLQGSKGSKCTGEKGKSIRFSSKSYSKANANSFSTGRKELNAPDLAARSGHSSRFSVTNWSNFPTQSPVCSRNDGLPTELVGITVSKHSNESIKAYGNAIVPEVAYQIFKAIDQYEKH